MAAISYPSAAPRRRPSPRPAAPGERHLRLIQGGRAARSARPGPGVYSRRRLVALALAVAIVMAGVLAVQAVGSMLVVRGGTAATVAPVEVPVGAEIHVVQPGETLWSIASERTDGGDVRATVDRLVERNGGVTSLQAGQRLLLD